MPNYEKACKKQQAAKEVINSLIEQYNELKKSLKVELKLMKTEIWSSTECSLVTEPYPTALISAKLKSEPMQKSKGEFSQVKRKKLKNSRSAVIREPIVKESSIEKEMKVLEEVLKSKKNALSKKSKAVEKYFGVLSLQSRCIDGLKNKLSELDESIDKGEKSIELCKKSLNQFDIVLPNIYINSDPSNTLDPFIAQCEKRLSWVTRVLKASSTNQNAHYLRFKEKLKPFLKNLKHFKDILLTVQKKSAAVTRYTDALNEEKRQLACLKAKQERVISDYERHLGKLKLMQERALKQKSLIPEDGLFTEGLNRFHESLQQFMKLKNKDPSLAGDIESIKKQYDIYYKQFAKALSQNSKPYELGWYAEEHYRQNIIAARKKLANRLKALTHPNANQALSKHRWALNSLGQLHRIVTLYVLPFTGVGLIYTGYRLFRHHQASAFKRKFSEAHGEAVQLSLAAEKIQTLSGG